MDFEFGPVTSFRQREEVKHLRQHAYDRHESRIINIESNSDTQRDEVGSNFLLREGRNPISTARIIPLGDGITKTESMGTLPSRYHNSSHCEVSRLSFYRKESSIKINGSTILLIGTQWLLERTELRYFVAHCKTKLLRKYRLLGAEQISDDIFMEHSEDPYCIIRADIYKAARVGKRLFPLSKVKDLEDIVDLQDLQAS